MHTRTDGKLPVPDPNELPLQLRKCHNWVCWSHKDGANKVPYSPLTNKPLKDLTINGAPKWSDFDTAATVAEETAGGVGIVTGGAVNIASSLDIACLDFDAHDITAPEVKHAADLFGCVERSYSGRGFHVYFLLDRDEWREKYPLYGKAMNRERAIEFYPHNQFLVVTGQWIEGIPHGALRKLDVNVIRAYLKEWKLVRERPEPKEGEPKESPPLTKQQLTGLLATDERFGQFWRNELEGSYHSRSEYDEAFCCRVAYYTQDPEAILGTYDEWCAEHPPAYAREPGKNEKPHYRELLVKKALGWVQEHGVHGEEDPGLDEAWERIAEVRQATPEHDSTPDPEHDSTPDPTPDPTPDLPDLNPNGNTPSPAPTHPPPPESLAGAMQAQEDARQQKIKALTEHYDNKAIALADATRLEIPPDVNLMGDSWAFRGAVVQIVSGTGTGKSVALTGFAISAALGSEWFGIRFNGQYRTLILQAENVDNDVKEIVAGHKNVHRWTPEQEAAINERIEIIEMDLTMNEGLFEVIRGLLRKRRDTGRLPDFLQIDPQQSFMGAESNNADAQLTFYRELGRIAKEFDLCIVVSAHTPKITNIDTTGWSAQHYAYAAAGRTEGINQVRASLVLWPTDTFGLFAVKAGKRAARIGWSDPDGEPVDTAYYRFGRPEDVRDEEQRHLHIAWVKCTPDEIQDLQIEGDLRAQERRERRRSIQADEDARALLDYVREQTGAGNEVSKRDLQRNGLPAERGRHRAISVRRVRETIQELTTNGVLREVASKEDNSGQHKVCLELSEKKPPNPDKKP